MHRCVGYSLTAGIDWLVHEHGAERERTTQHRKKKKINTKHPNRSIVEWQKTEGRARLGRRWERQMTEGKESKWRKVMPLRLWWWWGEAEGEAEDGKGITENRPFLSHELPPASAWGHRPFAHDSWWNNASREREPKKTAKKKAEGRKDTVQKRLKYLSFPEAANVCVCEWRWWEEGQQRQEKSHPLKGCYRAGNPGIDVAPTATGHPTFSLSLSLLFVLLLSFSYIVSVAILFCTVLLLLLILYWIFFHPSVPFFGWTVRWCLAEEWSCEVFLSHGNCIQTFPHLPWCRPTRGKFKFMRSFWWKLVWRPSCGVVAVFLIWFTSGLVVAISLTSGLSGERQSGQWQEQVKYEIFSSFIILGEDNYWLKEVSTFVVKMLGYDL